MLQVNASAVLRYEGDDTATIVGRHNRDNVEIFPLGERLPAEENSTIGRVLRTGAPARIDDWGKVTGEIADDGRGGADASGTGILGLRDRAEAAGGTLFVVSPPGRGTVVTAALPLAT